MKKPRDIPVRKWCLRLKAINTYLPLLEGGGNGDSLTKPELEKTIRKNIPRAGKIQFRLAVGHCARMVLEAQHVLLLLKKKDEKVAKILQKISRKRGNDDDNRDKGKNKEGK